MLNIDLSNTVLETLDNEAALLGTSLEQRVCDIINLHANYDKELVRKSHDSLIALSELIKSVPGVQRTYTSQIDEPFWWLKFSIDIKDELAWNVVQELGFVLNYISLTAKLPTVLMPVSPPPYLNGGPEEFLSWVIETKIPYLDPEIITDTIINRLPQPINDRNAWLEEDDNETNSND